MRVPRRRSGELGLANVEVVNARAEAWEEGLGAHDLVVARALAPLPVIVEYAAPLLALDGLARGVEGALRADRGGRRPRRGCGARHERAGRVPVEPFPGARDRLPLPQLEGQPYAASLPAPTGNGPQTADPSLELKVMVLRRRTKTCALRPGPPLA